LKVISQIKDKITTKELDEYAARTCAARVITHPDYAELAGRIIVSNHHKNTQNSFVDVIKFLYGNTDPHGKPSPLIGQKTYKVILDHKEYFEKIINYDRDFMVDYFGFKTLEKAYLLKTQLGHLLVQERPQQMYLRVAVGMHGDDLPAVKETYDLLSLQKLSHASPTLYNAGTPIPQLSSCFLLGIEDNLEGIYDSLKKSALISKLSGGIGVWASDVRSEGSQIRSTNGHSDGIIPMLRNFNETARYVNQGGKRKGGFAIYLEPHHADVEAFLDLRKTHGDHNQRCLDLFTAMWISDLFMKRLDQALDQQRSSGLNRSGDSVLLDQPVMWSLFCPDECPGLSDVHGDEYEALYLKYESDNKARKRVKILDLWDRILVSIKETGTPYLLYKDPVNARSPQMNIGPVKSSNLCAEIVLANSPQDETISVCNLAAMPLGNFIKMDENGNNPVYDFEDLGNSMRVAVQNLNKLIELNYYPVEDCRKSNMRDRPIGIGVVGLYDCFAKFRFPFDGEDAQKLNREIFECMYYYGVKTSMELAKKHGPYETFPGSPASQGKLQIDLWDEDRKKHNLSGTILSGKYDWDELRAQVKEHGMRNSTIMALMPTASTSNIIGMTECFECVKYNMYVRRVLSGDFKLVNKYLQNDLIKRNLWTEDFQQRLMSRRGSLQESVDDIWTRLQGLPKLPEKLRKIMSSPNSSGEMMILKDADFPKLPGGLVTLIGRYVNRSQLPPLKIDEVMKMVRLLPGGFQRKLLIFPEIDEDVRALYRTAFELSNRKYFDLAIGRSPFIDQTQSMNVFIKNPTNTMLTTIQMYAWRNRLKTGQYYLRSETKAQISQFTVRTPAQPLSSMADTTSSSTTGATGATGGGEQLCLMDDPTCEACQV